MESSGGTPGEAVSRRKVLRWLAISALGAGICLSVGGLANAAVPERKVETSGGVSTPSPTTRKGAPGASIRVKVMYFQMPNTVLDRTEEFFVLQSPSYFSDLMDEVVGKHTILSTMMPSMMKLVDGVPAQPRTPLKDGDEVDFIPAVAGG